MARTAGIVALVACALLVVAPAGAHRSNSATTAKIVSGGPEGAQGKVRSPKRSCRANRKVELFRVNELGGEDQSFGTATTDSNGDWAISAPLIAGEYYVKVKKATKKRNRKHRHRCKAAVSERVRL